MKGMIAVLGASLLLASVPSSGEAQDCRGCARKASINACVRCSLNSPDRQPHYTEAGIRRWCQANQPVCSKRGK